LLLLAQPTSLALHVIQLPCALGYKFFIVKIMRAQSNLSSSLSPSSPVKTDERQLPTRVPFTEASTAQLVRPLGAYERGFHRRAEELPLHFSLVAEFAGALEPEQLRQALLAVQQRHPLLSVHIEDHPGTRLGYYRSAVVPPIPLAVLDTDQSWEQVVAEELATPLDPTTAPLLRVALLRRGPAAATLVLTFDHVIADGKSAVYVLQDILTVLQGQPLALLPVPPSRETLLAQRAPGTPAGTPPVIPAPTTEQPAPAIMRPFDGSRPAVTSLAFGEALTGQLAQRCRAEQTTVHAALVAAASQVLASTGHRQLVRATSPVDIRPLLGSEVARACGMFFDAAPTIYTPGQPQDFWGQARAMSAQLLQGRAESMTRFISALMEQLLPVDIDHTTVKNISGSGGNRELFISNLGVLKMPEAGLLQPTAIWGPIILTQEQDESVLGLATLHGQLRLAYASYTPVPDFLVLIQELLLTHLSASGTGTQGAVATGYLRGLMAQETIY
jgi:hypothetical protein